MNKTELVAKVADITGVGRNDVRAVIDCCFDTITNILGDGRQGFFWPASAHSLYQRRCLVLDIILTRASISKFRAVGLFASSVVRIWIHVYADNKP